jgi:hypothetical protein
LCKRCSSSRYLFTYLSYNDNKTTIELYKLRNWCCELFIDCNFKAEFSASGQFQLFLVTNRKRAKSGKSRSGRRRRPKNSCFCPFENSPFFHHWSPSCKNWVERIRLNKFSSCQFRSNFFLRKLVPETGFQNWFPKLVPETGSRNWFPKLVPETGSRKWFPKKSEFVRNCEPIHGKWML